MIITLTISQDVMNMFTVENEQQAEKVRKRIEKMIRAGIKQEIMKKDVESHETAANTITAEIV